MIKINYLDDVNLYIETDAGTNEELSDYFAFRPKGYLWNPRYKAKIWDGYIRIYSAYKKLLPVGLLDLILKFARENDLDVDLDPRVTKCFKSDFDAEAYIDSLEIFDKGNIIKPWEHQRGAIIKAIKSKRMTLLAPTSSGKSLILYNICKYMLDNSDKDILLIVPSVSLVHQMASDFDNYANYDFENEFVHKIFAGQDKNTNKRITLTTWQSVFNQPKSWYDKFGMCLNDECFHGDSLVLTNKGYVQIKNINIGDIVLNYNEESQKFKEDKVLNVHKNLTNSLSEDMLELKFDNGKIIKVTANHKFLTNLGWVRADELTENHDIINNI